MKKILMIGAGIGQLYLARKIKSRGHSLIVVTLPGDYPVIEIADKVCYADVFDKKQVLKIAQYENVDAVISDQNDLMMPTVAYIAENMNIPGNTSEQINMYCNKNIYRNMCDTLNIPAPKHCAVTDCSLPTEFAKIPFPWIVKPADSQSSVGVAKVNDKTEYFIAITKALAVSKTNTAIVEEYFNGNELVAEGFIYKGKYYNFGYADRRYFKLENMFIPSQTIFPSSAPQSVLEKICKCEEQMSAKASPNFAIVHSEYLYDPDTLELRAVESALRGGGVYISSHLIPLSCNVDINELLIDCALGIEPNLDYTVSCKTDGAAAYVCFYLPRGTVMSITGINAIQSLPFVKMADIKGIEPGMQTPVLSHKGQRLGPVIISGDSRKDIEEKIEIIKSVLHIEVQTSEGRIADICWE